MLLAPYIVPAKPPYDIAVTVLGKPAAGALVAKFVAPRKMTLPAGLPGLVFDAGTAPTGTATFTIKQNGASIGTLAFQFVVAATVVTVTFAAAVQLAKGDVLTVTAPGSQDATLADLAFTIPALQ